MKKLYQFVLATILGLAIGTITANCAHTTAGQFKDAVVVCTMENSNNAQAGAAVVSCLTAAVGGDYAGCLAGLVSVGHWSVDEVACIVRRLATESAQRINSGTSTTEDGRVLSSANQWLRDNQIRFK
jgi:hypothetical protein